MNKLHEQWAKCVICTCVLVPIASAATAQNIALDTICWISTPAGRSQTIATYFNVNSPIIISELDVMNVVLNPLATNPVPVGLWNSNGTLLTSASVSTSNPENLTISASGNVWYGSTISPITLNPGLYAIGEFQTSADQSIYTPDYDVVLDSNFSFVGYGLTASNSLVKPTMTVTSETYFGASFKYSSAAPEPGIITLVSATGITGTLYIWRKRKK